MTNKELIIKKLDKLPPSAQLLVKEFIELLCKSLGEEQATSGLSQKSVLKGEFIGMWKDRKDLEDSSGFVRDLRIKHWQKIND